MLILFFFLRIVGFLYYLCHLLSIFFVLHIPKTYTAAHFFSVALRTKIILKVFSCTKSASRFIFLRKLCCFFFILVFSFGEIESFWIVFSCSRDQNITI